MCSVDGAHYGSTVIEVHRLLSYISGLVAPHRLAVTNCLLIESYSGNRMLPEGTFVADLRSKGVGPVVGIALGED